MTIDEELEQYLAEQKVKFGSISVPHNSGHMQMAESFSATGFLDMIERDYYLDGDRTFDLLTNLGEYVPLIMTTNIIVTPSQLIESFQSSMRMFDRGAAYPLIWDRASVRRNALAEMEKAFFSYNDTLQCFETSPAYHTRSNSLLLAVRPRNSDKSRIVMCGVIKNEDYKFVMALRRHNKPIPRSLITILQDEDFDTTSFEFPATRQFYRTRVKDKLLEAKVRIDRVPRTVLEELIFKPDKKFESFDEMKEDGKANWRLLVKSREDGID